MFKHNWNFKHYILDGVGPISTGDSGMLTHFDDNSRSFKSVYSFNVVLYFSE